MDDRRELGPGDDSFRDVRAAVLLSAALVSASFLLQGYIGVDLADEGFLWYGTWRTALGEVPIRDFQSYDPGRYYWGALWSGALGTGLLALRASSAVFQFLGLTFGLLVLRRLTWNSWFLLVTGTLLLVWMFPRHKLFEPSIAMATVYVGVRLLERQSRKMDLIAGVFVGVAAFFGRNHGIYALVAFLLLILFSRFEVARGDLPKRIGAWALGIVVGYSPMLCLFAFVPGFFEDFMQSIARLFEAGATNLALPPPWPWTAWDAGEPGGGGIGASRLSGFVVGLIYVAWPALIGVVALYSLRRREPLTRAQKVLVASVVVSLPYFHHAMVRADLPHLAQSIHPALIGFLAAAWCAIPLHRRFLVPTVLGILGLISLLSVFQASPLYERLRNPRHAYVWKEVAGDPILMKRNLSHLITTVEGIDEAYLDPADAILVAPYWPMLYPILDRRSPLREIYFTSEPTQTRQQAMIAELEQKSVRWALVGNVGVDRRADLLFQTTHQLLWNHLAAEFAPLPIEGLPGRYRLLQRRVRREPSE